MTNHTEREFKLRARQTIEIAAIDAALRELETNCRLSTTRRHSDTYLDDDRASLHQQGIGLRVRSNMGTKTLCCKTRAKTDSGLFVRQEFEADWISESLPKSANDLPDAIQALLRPWIGNRELVPQQVLSVHREIRMLTDGDEDLCELAIDYVVAQANERSATWQEIELEVCSNLEANQELAQNLQKRLPVEFAKQDKPSYAAALLGMELPGAPSVEEQALATVYEAVPERLQAMLVTAQSIQQKLAQNDDPALLQELHSTFQTMHDIVHSFAEIWPTDVAARVGTELRKSQHQIDSLADLVGLQSALDEQLQKLPQPLLECGREVSNWVQSKRKIAFERMQKWISDTEHQSAENHLEQDLKLLEPKSELAQAQLMQAAPLQLAAAIQQLRAQIDATPVDLPAAQIAPLLQAVQIAHNLAEHFSDLPGKSYKKSLKAINRAQRHIKSLQQHQTNEGILLSWIISPSVDGDQRVLHAAVLGSLATMNHWAERETREVALHALERLDRDQVWARFADHSADTASDV